VWNGEKTNDGRAITIGMVNPKAKSQDLELRIDGVNVSRTAPVWRIAGK
jgi:hypothetical protein